MTSHFERAEKITGETFSGRLDHLSLVFNELHNRDNNEVNAVYRNYIEGSSKQLEKQHLLPNLEITGEEKTGRTAIHKAKPSSSVHSRNASAEERERQLESERKHPGHEYLHEPTSDAHSKLTRSEVEHRPEGKKHHAAADDQYGTEKPGTASESKAMARLVASVAAEMGMSKHATLAAVASMLHESGGNPIDRGDRAHGHYTSFGLFQLHERGELTDAHLTPQQAFDPRTNARVALLYFQQHSGQYSDYGKLAAAAQRPKNKDAYAETVDKLVPEARLLLGW